MVCRTPDRVARSAIARSGVQHKALPRSGSIFSSKTWIPDLRGGFAAACPGNASADVIYAGNVICAGGGANRGALQHQYPDVVGITTRSRMQMDCGSL